jgi:hypothetical protein
MNANAARLGLILASGLIYWQLTCLWSGSMEPWDSDRYLTLWYPVSIILSGCGGYLLGKRGWISGAVITFGQVPIVIVNNGIGPLLAAGLLILVFMAIPPIIVAFLTGRYAARRKTGSIT